MNDRSLGQAAVKVLGRPGWSGWSGLAVAAIVLALAWWTAGQVRTASDRTMAVFLAGIVAGAFAGGLGMLIRAAVRFGLDRIPGWEPPAIAAAVANVAAGAFICLVIVWLVTGDRDGWLLLGGAALSWIGVSGLLTLRRGLLTLVSALDRGPEPGHDGAEVPA